MSRRCHPGPLRAACPHSVSHQMLGEWHPARWPLLVPFSPGPTSKFLAAWPCLKFTLATAGGSLNPLHESAANLLPRLCCEHCVLEAHGPASPILPSLGSDLSLCSGLQTSSAVSGLVTLRLPFTSTILPHLSQFILHTNLSLSPKGPVPSLCSGFGDACSGFPSLTPTLPTTPWGGADPLASQSPPFLPSTPLPSFSQALCCEVGAA